MATLDEIRGHQHVLTPGRYVGAELAEEDAEPFDAKMTRLAATLREQMAEGRSSTGRSRRTWRRWAMAAGSLVPAGRIAGAIVLLRGHKVMLAAAILKSQTVTSNGRDGGRKLPAACTEQGGAMQMLATNARDQMAEGTRLGRAIKKNLEAPAHGE